MIGPNVIDLTQRVKPRRNEAHNEILARITDLFNGIGGVLCDVDGTLAHGIEPLHKEFWLGALVGVARASLGKHFDGVMLEIKLNVIRAQLQAHLDQVFSHGGFVMGMAHEILAQAEALPDGNPSIEELDQLVGKYRIPLIEQAIDEGRVELMVDTVPMFEYLRSTFHARIGIYTNSDIVTGSTICRRLFGQEAFDRLIRGTADKPRRLFGSDVPRDKRKPHPFGWGLLAQNMQRDPRVCAIMEDRPNVMQEAFDAFPFRFGVLVVAPDHLRSVHAYETKLQHVRHSLEGWEGQPIILVRNLARLRMLLQRKFPPAGPAAMEPAATEPTSDSTVVS